MSIGAVAGLGAARDRIEHRQAQTSAALARTERSLDRVTAEATRSDYSSQRSVARTGDISPTDESNVELAGVATTDAPRGHEQPEELGNAFGPDATQADHERAEKYFAQHDTYIDPVTGIEYDAEFDPETGELTLRNDRLEPAGTVPGGIDARDDRMLDESTTLHSNVEAPLSRRALALQQARDSARAIADGMRVTADARRGHSTLDDPPAESPAGSIPEDDAGGSSEGPQVLLQEEVILSMDGSRDTTRRYNVPASNLRVVEQVSTDPEGVVESGRVSRTAQQAGPDGSEHLATNDIYGRNGVLVERDRVDRTVSRDGAVTVDQGSARFEQGRPSHSERHVEWTFGPATATEDTTTVYADGVPTSTIVEQRAHDTSDHGFPRVWKREEASRTLTLGYDTSGAITSVAGGGPEDASPLDVVVADHPMQDGSTFAFGYARTHSGSTDGIATPGYVTQSGLRHQVRGVEVFQEGGRAGQSGEMADSITSLRTSIDQAPPSKRGSLDRVDLLLDQNTQDAYWEEAFGLDDFRSTATGGNGVMTFYNGGVPSDKVFDHEFGHISGDEGGAPDEAAWATAMESDRGIDDRFVRQGEQTDDLLIIDTDLLAVNPYADNALVTTDSENEDWAESVSLWMYSRENGGMVTVQRPDGTIVTASFADLYPARAAIIEEYYSGT